MIYFTAENVLSGIPGLIIGLSAAGSGVISARFANRIDENILSKAVAIIFMIFGTVMTIIGLW